MDKFDANLEAMLETFIFESSTLLEQLDAILLKSEKSNDMAQEDINEIFRIMHTIKGSAAMMGIENISLVAHRIEDLFYIIRENKTAASDYSSIYDIVFQGSDFIRKEIDGILDASTSAANPDDLIGRIEQEIAFIKSPAAAKSQKKSGDTGKTGKQKAPAKDTPKKAPVSGKPMSKVRVFFEEGTKMENIRAYMLVNSLKDYCEKITYEPEDIESNPETAAQIVEDGFIINFLPYSTNEDIYKIIESALNIKSFEPLEGDTYARETPVVEKLSVLSGKPMSVVRVYFEDGCKMENIRAFMLVNNLKDYCERLTYEPEDIEFNQATAKQIIDNGFIISFVPYTSNEEIYKLIETSLYIKSYEPLGNDISLIEKTKVAAEQRKQEVEQKAAEIESVNSAVAQTKAVKQSLISVNLNKLDELMDVVGELVITESMVTSNPDLKGLQLENFTKASRQLRKLTDELQDIVMSIRMVPISGVFNKMNRIVRDMSKKLDKDVELSIIGEDTEVDKTIIDSLGDPLMHLIRNAMDHGLEAKEERLAKGKTGVGRVILSAKNTAGEVIIQVIDDGAGINPSVILKKARMNGLLTKADSEYTEKEIFNLILLPGFSTNTVVTEFSGRGVGMDVVKKNIEKVGGSISIDSKLGKGTTFNIKIPLTLAIVDGMEISVGGSILTIPITSIRESFKIAQKQIVKDVNNNEMVMIRGECYPVIRLYQAFGIETSVKSITEGIVILVETEEKAVCLLADQLIGEQQVVVKPLPTYLSRYNVKDCGIAGCTILGDGSISLILDIKNLIAHN